MVTFVTRLRPTHWLWVATHLPMTIADASCVICCIDIPEATDVVGSSACCTLLMLMALVAQSPAMTRTIRKTPLKANNFFFIFYSFVVNSLTKRTTTEIPGGCERRAPPSTYLFRRALNFKDSM